MNKTSPYQDLTKLSTRYQQVESQNEAQDSSRSTTANELKQGISGLKNKFSECGSEEKETKDPIEYSFFKQEPIFPSRSPEEPIPL